MTDQRPTPPPTNPPSSAWDTDHAGRAGFGQRLIALTIDVVLYGLAATMTTAAGVAMIVAAFSDCSDVSRPDGSTELECPPGAPSITLLVGGLAVIVLGLALIAFVYLRGVAVRGQSWGKRIVGIEVIRSDGGAPGYARAFVRELFAGVVSSSFCYLGFLWMLWDRRRQTWHDKVVDTVVVTTRSRPPDAGARR